MQGKQNKVKCRLGNFPIQRSTKEARVIWVFIEDVAKHSGSHKQPAILTGKKNESKTLNRVKKESINKKFVNINSKRLQKNCTEDLKNSHEKPIYIGSLKTS